MFEATRMLFLYVETPLHSGSGRGLGAVDLPIQRERITNYPIVQASSIKGRMRAACDPKLNSSSKLSKQEHLAIFGPEAGEGASDYAGAISFGDARLLLFPVRSLAGVFAWTTSVDALQRFQRTAEIVGLSLAAMIPPAPPDKETAWVNGDVLVAGESVVLEEFSFKPDQTHATAVNAIGQWLANYALPQTPEYQYWRAVLPQKLCILPEDAFRDFVQYATEVQTHIKINPETKTVATGALWTTESLPSDTLLYAPIMATKTREKNTPLTAKEVIQKVIEVNLTRTQLGGDETTGQGIVALRFSDGGEG
ncbi:MAG: type III-B CRISPR module RAMP protein Cmr4 [Anaerolineales bacterium]|nr:type III-B CRISPR module RAMP protein Cmr4 [Anaerolineales bacterium]MCS7249048.1 type III-B CRISPR module RAMP protein Cmr4 [Anaerolineales bacterium]MCX8063408.1 type III-B CRISPR module RAMP protein Cmr4 [Anaerolineales bacterium]MDW8162861.1 type III-B CRISPR module RAMP protein Cmr4 [Anaerolineales bacterium]